MLVLWPGAAALRLWSQQSAYLPAPGDFVVTPSYTYRFFDHYRAGGDRKGDAEVDQHSALLGIEYGFSDRIAFDLGMGYTRGSVEWRGTSESSSGLADTTLGARYQLLDEFTAFLPILPTVTFRAGAIIEGTYDVDSDLPVPFLPGDGASGFETSLLLGKMFGESSWGVYGDVGYRVRFGVPDELTGGIGAYKTFLDRLTASFGYRYAGAVSGRDLNPETFGAGDLAELDDSAHRLEIGIGFSESAKRYYQVYGGRILSGRNTGEGWVVGGSATFTF